MDIPRYNTRLDCFIFKLKFPLLLLEAREQIELLDKAVSLVHSLASLRRLLEVVLAIGNYLNGGSPRGGIYGFKLDSLLKLAAVKSVDNKCSLMNYLAQHCEKFEPQLLELNEELVVSEEASRVSIDGIRADITTLKKNVETIEAQIQACEADKDRDKEDRFAESLKPFKVSACKEVEALEKVFSGLCVKFAETVEPFGEDVKITAEEFFGLLRDFASAFDKAKKENEKRRVMLEKAEKKKRAEEAARINKEAKLKGPGAGVEGAEGGAVVVDVVGAQRCIRSEEIMGQLKASGQVGHHRNR